MFCIFFCEVCPSTRCSLCMAIGFFGLSNVPSMVKPPVLPTQSWTAMVGIIQKRKASFLNCRELNLRIYSFAIHTFIMYSLAGHYRALFIVGLSPTVYQTD
jgi:hypothetical protein